MHLDIYVATAFKLFSNLSAISFPHRVLSDFTLTFNGTAFEQREYDVQGDVAIEATIPDVA